MGAKNKELRDKSRRIRPEMGILRIRGLQSGKCWLLAAPNLNGAVNGSRFKLDTGSFPCRELQKQWSEQGETGFAFEVLDRLEYDKDETKTDYREDLDTLFALWEEKLRAGGAVFYAR